MRHFTQFESVFGSGSDRVVKVLAGQAANTAIAQHHQFCLDDSVCNPDDVEVDAYAIAPYFGKDIDGAATDAIDQLRADISNAAQNCENHADLLDGDMDLICYEGGQHVTVNAIDVNRNPEMHSVYTEYLEALEEHIDGIFVHYAHEGYFLLNGCWGALEYTGQPLNEAPKYRALMDYARTISLITNAVLQTWPVYNLVIDTDTGNPSSLYIAASTNLLDNSWADVAHSDNPHGPYVVSNFNFSTSLPAGRSIYLKADADTRSEFFRIEYRPL